MATYGWAVNDIKVQHAIAYLNRQKALNPTMEITEQAVKDRYILMGGLLTEDKPEIVIDPKTHAVMVKRESEEAKELKKVKKELEEVKKKKEVKEDVK